MKTTMIIFASFSRALWLVGATKVYSGLEVGIVMESIAQVKNCRMGSLPPPRRPTPPAPPNASDADGVGPHECQCGKASQAGRVYFPARSELPS